MKQPSALQGAADSEFGSSSRTAEAKPVAASTGPAADLNAIEQENRRLRIQVEAVASTERNLWIRLTMQQEFINRFDKDSVGILNGQPERDAQ